MLRLLFVVGRDIGFGVVLLPLRWGVMRMVVRRARAVRIFGMGCLWRMCMLRLGLAVHLGESEVEVDIVTLLRL